MANKSNKNFKVVKGNGPAANNRNVPKKPMDPQMTIDVKNPQLLELIGRYREEKTPAVLNQVMDLLDQTRVLVPAAMRQVNDKMLPVPAVFANKDGERFVWAFTDREQLPKQEDQPKVGGYMNMAFKDLVNLATIPEENLKGISINPRTEGIVMTQMALNAFKEGKRAPESLPQRPVTDPQLTIEVSNDELEAALATYKAENSAKNLLTLIESALKTRILTPVILKDVDGKKLPAPVLLNDSEGRKLIPVYTSKNHIPKNLKTGIINLPFTEIIKAAAKEVEGDANFFGVVFDPTEFGIRFAPRLITVLAEHPDDPQEALKVLATTAAPATKTVKLTEQQYMAFEHMQFENAYLPAELFTGGKEFIEKLCEEKENYVDQLFEESYREKRMYPYLPEDFSVMALGVEEGLEIVRVDFPAQDQGIGGCSRAYLTWEEKGQKAQYFGIVIQANKQQTLVEITSDGKRLDYGPCPTEGMELNKIVELVHASKQ